MLEKARTRKCALPLEQTIVRFLMVSGSWESLFPGLEMAVPCTAGDVEHSVDPSGTP